MIYSINQVAQLIDALVTISMVVKEHRALAETF
jgi:hypothetical protein